jgi:hypothetical protein
MFWPHRAKFWPMPPSGCAVSHRRPFSSEIAMSERPMQSSVSLFRDQRLLTHNAHIEMPRQKWTISAADARSTNRRSASGG